jgi:N-(5'phosphoribosyl)anthranilate (PRA) isomerase
MPLTGVTITGADDDVDVLELARLSREYPFVEWGILISASQVGNPRYPTALWTREFAREVCAKGSGMLTSYHLCGSYARDALLGTTEIVDNAAATGARIQINGAFARLSHRHFYDFVPMAARRKCEFILQCPSEEALLRAEVVASDVGTGRVSALFDPSGGSGLFVPAWPPPPPGLHVGYAGGINPENVESVLDTLGSVNKDQFWIDMESGVRTDGRQRFDLDKVALVLERAKKFAWR